VHISGDQIIQRGRPIADLPDKVLRADAMCTPRHLYESARWRAALTKPNLNSRETFNSHEAAFDTRSIAHLRDGGSDGVVREVERLYGLVGNSDRLPYAQLDRVQEGIETLAFIAR
jgi:hypothetical protein